MNFDWLLLGQTSDLASSNSCKVTPFAEVPLLVSLTSSLSSFIRLSSFSDSLLPSTVSNKGSSVPLPFFATVMYHCDIDHDKNHTAKETWYNIGLLTYCGITIVLPYRPAPP